MFGSVTVTHPPVLSRRSSNRGTRGISHIRPLSPNPCIQSYDNWRSGEFYFYTVHPESGILLLQRSFEYQMMSEIPRTVQSIIDSIRQSAAEYPQLRVMAGAQSESAGGIGEYMSEKIDNHLSEDAERLLDVGGGHTVRKYTSRVAEEQENIDVFCSDIQDLSQNPNGLSYIQSDACSLPYENNTFDLVYSKSFFSHVWNHSKALDEQIRVLKPGGKLIIIDESLTNPDRLFDWMVAWPIRTSFKRGGPLWLLNKDEIKVDGKGRKYKQEDHYTAFYWSKMLEGRSDLELDSITSPYTESWPRIHSIAQSNDFLKKVIASYSIRIVAIGTKL